MNADIALIPVMIALLFFIGIFALLVGGRLVYEFSLRTCGKKSKILFKKLPSLYLGDLF
ncbi:MAG: hypothetical protein M0Q91_10580 [Methanoregula sp.]|nr:hypothetical protein [Methanoregula sp.]